MTLFAIESPYPLFKDLDGSPLDGGYLFFGAENQNPETSTITVYWDAAGTQPAAQPVRTLNGFIVRGGTPAQLYVNVAYSLSVRNRRGKFVYGAPSSIAYSQASATAATVTAFIASLAAPSGSTLSGHIQGDPAGVALPNAVATTVAQVLNETISVTRYMSAAQIMNAYLKVANLDCGPAIQKAINDAGGKTLLWPAGYFFASAQELIVRVTQYWRGGGKGRMQVPWDPAGVSISELRTLGNGNAYKGVKTRRNWRGSVADAQDPTMSALVNVQCQNFQISGMTVRCNYVDATVQTTPLYYGDDWDVGIFVGCRLGFKHHDLAVVGAWRVLSIYNDYTRGPGLPELFGWDGVQHPTDLQYGCDNISGTESVYWGSGGVAVLGALPRPGLTSYGVDVTTSLVATVATNPIAGDTITLGGVVFTFQAAAAPPLTVAIGGTAAVSASNLAAAATAYALICDRSLTAFLSAVYVLSGVTVATFPRVATSTAYATTFTTTTASGGRITLSGAAPTAIADPAPYYDQGLGATVSDQRGNYGNSDILYEGCYFYGGQSPTRYARQAIRPDLNWLIDTCSGAFYIDGLAGNAARRGQGHRYINCRFQADYEAFCVRLGRSNRDDFFGCQFDGAGTTGFFNPDGSNVGTNPATCKYGPITRVPGVTTLTRMYGMTSVPFAAYFQLDDNGSFLFGSQNGTTNLTGDLNLLRGTLTLDTSADSTVGALIQLTPGSGARGTIQSSRDLGLTSTGGALRYTGLSTGTLDAGVAHRWMTDGISEQRMTPTEIIPYVTVRPNNDNIANLGAPGNRWATVYAGTGAINTSDATTKQDSAEITDDVLDAWAEVKWMRFRFIDAVLTKGDTARTHFGVIAQDVEKAFQAHGLDPFAYGVLCWDEWSDEWDTREDGARVLVRTAGSRYGVRYDEALALEAALMRRSVARMQARLAAAGIA